MTKETPERIEQAYKDLARREAQARERLAETPEELRMWEVVAQEA